MSVLGGLATAGRRRVGAASSTFGRAGVLVLGLGNTLLRDDGVGLQLLESVQQLQNDWGERVDFIDGGTQGLALLPYIAERHALVVLDAIALGGEPGTIHILTGEQLADLKMRRATTAHEGNAGELLATARLLGDCPEKVYVVGIEPDAVRTGVGVSDAVACVLPHAVERAAALIQQILTGAQHVLGDSRQGS